MKKLIISIMAVMVVFAASAAFAADETKTTIGLKAWNNSWKQTFTDSSGSTSIESEKAILMIGPSVNIQFSNNWFIGAQYLASTSDYEFFFPESFYEVSTLYLLDATFFYSRADFDLMAGYMFNPQFGLYFGYKSITSDESVEFCYSGTSICTDKVKYGTLSVTGPGIGILGNIPLSETVALYGNLSVMSLSYEEKFEGDGTDTADLTGASIEIGVAFALSQSFSASVGIKSQTLSGDVEGGGTIDNNFVGLTAGINYTF